MRGRLQYSVPGNEVTHLRVVDPFTFIKEKINQMIRRKFHCLALHQKKEVYEALRNQIYMLVYLNQKV